MHCGQYHIGTAGKRRLGAAHILCLSVCMEDFSLTLEMTMRESSSHQSLVTSYSSLLSNFWDSHFSYRHPERSRGIFLALRSVSHRHCRKATPWCYTHPLFIGLHGRFLACARNDNTGADVSKSPSLSVSAQSPVTKHSSLLILSHSYFLSNFWGSHFSYRHLERSREIFLALRSVSHRHCRETTPWCYTHPLFFGLHGRFLACARNDDTGVRGLLVTNHKSLAIRPCFQIFGAAIPRIVIPSAAEGSFLHLRSVSHRHYTEATPWCCTHPLFIGLQRRFLACARNDDARVF